MARLQEIFEMVAGADAEAVLSTPNLAYVVEVLRRAGETLSADDLEQIYADEGWLPDRSFTWLELQALQHRIQQAGGPPSPDATADETSGECADDNAVPAMPGSLPAVQEEGPE
mgnify:CR=1 FL=1